MKKSILILICFVFAISVNAQQSFLTGENATNVLGQVNFVSSSMGVSPTEMQNPTAIAISSKGVLAVGMNARVLIWNSLPTTAGQAADLVIGQSDLISSSTGCSQGTLNSGIGGLCFTPDGNKLIVADSDNNRVLIFDTPTVNGQNANIVIGQPDFMSNSPSVNSSSFNNPKSVFVTADGKLIVCDVSNNRVLVFNSIPTTNYAQADIVIGQNDFISGTSGSSLNKFSAPSSCIVTKEGKLLVADQYNARVLVFGSSALTLNGPTAEIIIGTGVPSVSQNDLNTPSGLACSADGKVFISDFNNNRISVYNTLPTTSSANADAVLGQVDFVSAVSGTNVSSFFNTLAIATDVYGRLFVTDYGNNRVVIFGSTPVSFTDFAVNVNNVSNLCVGSNFVTTITVTNNGPNLANNTVIKTAIPNQFNYFSSNAGVGTYTASTGMWNIPSLSSGATTTLTINGSLTSTLTQTFPFYATVDYTEKLDTILFNNISSLLVNTHPNVVPTINVSSSANPACSNTAVTLTATGATGYTWSTGPTTSAIVLNPAIAGVFSVVGSNAQGCTSSISITQTVTNAPTTANAGSDLSICGSNTTLNANTPTIGTGVWSVISGPGTITSQTSASTTVTGLSIGTNTFRWTITSMAPCATSSDDVVITSNAIPTVSISTFSPICFSVATYSLTGGTPAGGVYSGTGVVGGVLQTLPLSGNQTITYTYTDANTCTNSATQNIFIESGSTISGIVNANSNAITSGNVYLLAYNNQFLMDTIQTFAQSATNSFVFNNVPPDDYIIFAQPDIANNSGAYNGNVSFWQNATPFTIDCSSTQTFTIETTTLATLTGGTGSISGSVSEGPNFGSGKVDIAGDPIPGVDVSLEQNPGGIILANTQTTSDGKYLFENISAGSYTILVDIPGSGMISSHTLDVADNQDWINLDYYVDSNKVYINETSHPDIVGILNIKNSNISVYPNPSNGKITITNALSIDDIQIISLTGAKITAPRITNTINTEIDLSEMPSGIYFIEIRDKNTTYRTKIIKQ